MGKVAGLALQMCCGVPAAAAPSPCHACLCTPVQEARARIEASLERAGIKSWELSNVGVGEGDAFSRP